MVDLSSFHIEWYRQFMKGKHEIHVANEQEYHTCIALFRELGCFTLSRFDKYEYSYLYPYDSGFNDEPWIHASDRHEFSDLYNIERIYELWN